MYTSTDKMSSHFKYDQTLLLLLNNVVAAAPAWEARDDFLPFLLDAVPFFPGVSLQITLEERCSQALYSFCGEKNGK